MMVFWMVSIRDEETACIQGCLVEWRVIKMQTTLCLICGWNFGEYYSGGDICPCCFNEYDFDDFLFKEEILEKYCSDRKKVHSIAPEIDDLNDVEEAPRDVTWRFLRLAWVKKGCPFKCAKEEGVEKWTIEDAKKQLGVLGYKYDTLVRLADEIIDRDETDESPD